MADQPGRALTPAEIPGHIPHRAPFRFIDEVIEVDEQRSLARYTFRRDEFFYRGHFPALPVTPGVILVEAMCQMGLGVLGLYLKSLEGPVPTDFTSVLTDGEMEFLKPVYPGETVCCRAEKIFWKHGKLRAKVELLRDGSPVCFATMSTLAVERKRLVVENG